MLVVCAAVLCWVPVNSGGCCVIVSLGLFYDKISASRASVSYSFILTVFKVSGEALSLIKTEITLIPLESLNAQDPD